jgi:2-(1,2-epoxy-1,2-dihydrophenyl)acetyl-CoA isomerase
MAQEPLVLSREAGVARITLDRPDLGNALTDEVARLLDDAVDTIAADTTVRAVVMTGNGPLFCAGGDIRQFTLALDDLGRHIGAGLVTFNRTLEKLAALPVPVITALNGPVAGGGIGLALTADIVLAASSARFRAGYAAIGLSPDAGTSYHLTRLIGPQRAKEFLFTNRFIDAPEALALGLVVAVVPDDELRRATDELVATILRFPAGSHAAVKSLVDAASGMDHAEALAREREAMIENAESEACREGIRAFMERRAPAFATPVG